MAIRSARRNWFSKGSGVSLFGALAEERKPHLLHTAVHNGMTELVYVPR